MTKLDERRWSVFDGMFVAVIDSDPSLLSQIELDVLLAVTCNVVQFEEGYETTAVKVQLTFGSGAEARAHLEEGSSR